MSNNQTGKDVIEIDLLELAQVLFRRIGIIILCTILVAAMAFGYTYFFIEPLYTASAMMYVNNSSFSIGSTSVSISALELSAAQSLVDTYTVILMSRMTLEEVIEADELEYTYDELYDMIDVEAVNSTEIFQINVTSTSAAEARSIANTIVEVLPDKIASIVDGSDVRIVDYAVTPSVRTSPSYTRNTALGGLVGLFLAAAVIIIRYLFDEEIHAEDYLTKTYSDIPLLAVIPDMSSPTKNNKYYYYGRRPTQTSKGTPTPRSQKRSQPSSQPESRRTSSSTGSTASTARQESRPAPRTEARPASRPVSRTETRPVTRTVSTDTRRGDN